MANSERFRSFDKRINQLRRNLLPSVFSPSGDYSAKDLDMTKGFRLLVHAEIESYLEDICRDTLLDRVKAWYKKREPSDLIICFLACYHSGWTEGLNDDSKPMSPKTRVKVKDAAEEAVELAVDQYLNMIKSSHGIRESNFKHLVIPLGIRVGDLDSLWLLNLDEYGKKRGEIAHTTVGAHHPIDPKSEWSTVKQLKKGLKSLDHKIINLT